MELSSVRALKAEIGANVIEPRVLRGDGLKSLGTRAQSINRFQGVQRTVALGIAKGKKKGDYKLAVRIQNRLLEENPDFLQEFQDRAKGEVDVRFVGRLVALAVPWYQQRQRPMLIGASVAHAEVTAGTIGAFVRHLQSDRVGILSNNHVLANEGVASPGDPVLQPGPFDRGRPSDRIGDLLDFVPMNARNNLVDAAIATIDDSRNFDARSLRDLGQLAGVRPDPLQPGDQVAKVGRTTGVTYGTVTAIELDEVVITYDRGALSFDQQIEIEGAGPNAFSAGGDSGSLIVDRRFRAAALLFAGGDVGGRNGKGLTYANPIAAVISALGLEFPPAGP